MCVYILSFQNISGIGNAIAANFYAFYHPSLSNKINCLFYSQFPWIKKQQNFFVFKK